MSDLSSLNDYCLEHLFTYFSLEDLVKCRECSKKWQKAADSQVKWWIEKLQKFQSENDIILSRWKDWRYFCKHFIDQGNIEDIARFSKLLIDSINTIERPMNRFGPHDWLNPLHLAVTRGNMDGIKFLLKTEAPINGKYEGKTAFILACEQKDPEIEIIKLFLDSSLGLRIFAVLKDIDFDGLSGFGHLCKNGVNDIIEFILDKILNIKKANNEPQNECDKNRIQIKTPSGNIIGSWIENWRKIPLEFAPGSEGKTALMVAIASKKPSLIKLLVKKGADINSKDKNGKTPLMYAVWHGDLEMVKAFFNLAKETKIDFNIGDNVGRTAFMYSCMFKMNDIMDLFRQKAEEFGIDLLVKDRDGLIASDYIDAMNEEGEFEYNDQPIKAEEWNKMDPNQRRKRLAKGTFYRSHMGKKKRKYYNIDEDMPVSAEIYNGHRIQGTPAEIQAAKERYLKEKAAKEKAAKAMIEQLTRDE